MTEGRAISYRTYVMFMKKYNLPKTPMKVMQHIIYTYEAKHEQNIKDGLYLMQECKINSENI